MSGWASARNLVAAASLAALAQGCKRNEDTFLVVQADLDVQSTVPIAALKVTVKDAAGREASHSFAGDQAPSLPSSFSLQLPRDLASPLWIEVVALSANGMPQAKGVLSPVEITAGARLQVKVVLQCLQGCTPDAGAPDAGAPYDAPPGGADAVRSADGKGLCGNGLVDDGELCDSGILPGRWGACPAPDCNDGLACTIDTPVGSGCWQRCEHSPRLGGASGDGCCAEGATAATDSDCSNSCGNGTVEAAAPGKPGETCDLAIAAEQAGACPTAPSCDDDNACTTDSLISAGTCAAVCVNRPVLDTAAADGCCAPGSSNVTDPDCPAVCGNGRKDLGETCDRGALAGSAAACPQSCEDNDPCTRDLLEGAGCQMVCRNLKITDREAGDRCCPMGATRDVDPDCPAICGNKILEPGEACDKGLVAPAPGACPTGCAASTAACLTRRLEGRSDDCTARCTDESGPALCSTTSDGCCSERCTSVNDPDCSPTCGNGVVEASETCDTAIVAGSPGACPSVCNDSVGCTSDILVSRGTCSARCAHVPITATSSGDGCCPPGANPGLDGDCPAQCGDGMVTAPKETCDEAITTGQPGACPGSCPAPASCMRATLVGDPDTCTSRCQVETVKACAHGDGCCPTGCNRQSDDDCQPVCGNGQQEAGEACDRTISAGQEGACATSCNDNKACTADSTLGRISDCSRFCRNEPITACKSGDGCCPTGCLALQDRDCVAVCGNGVVETEETCDPPSKCPGLCPDDKDPCTFQRLLGDAATCTAVCVYTPIVLCSGKSADKCCPSICSAVLDVDCATPPPVQVGGVF
jgi:hypothetical protein